MLGDDLEVEFPRSENEAREGSSTGWRQLLFTLQEAGGAALEERSFTARRKVSQQIQQFW